jgi:hypothetical protein
MKNKDSVVAVLLAAVTLVCTGSSVSQTPLTNNAGASGSVCVLPNSPKPPTMISPGGMYNPETLTVRIDKREALRWPHKAPALIDALDPQGNHLIVLTSDGRQIMSARFRFADYHDTRLCAYFDGYQGIQLGNTSDALWCKVKKRACWRDATTNQQR